MFLSLSSVYSKSSRFIEKMNSQSIASQKLLNERKQPRFVRLPVGWLKLRNKVD